MIKKLMMKTGSFKQKIQTKKTIKDKQSVYFLMHKGFSRKVCHNMAS